MKSSYVKLSKLAKDLKVTKTTLYNWHRAGNLDFYKPYENNNYNYVTLEDYNKLLGIKEKEEEKVIIYARVSSSKNKNNLDTQVERLVNYCNAKGYRVYKVVKEVGSGLNDKRPLLEKLLLNNDYTKIVIEHKDRLTRFGFNYLEILAKLQHKEIEVVNNVDTDEQDLIQDFVSIITSYCARVYGYRRVKRKTEKLLEELKTQD